MLTWRVLTLPAQGTLGDIDASAGTIAYAPALDAHGDDTFTLAVSDGATEVPVPVAVTIRPVNDAPQPTAPAVSTDEDVAAAIAPSATDADGDGLTWSVLAGPAHGRLEEFSAATGAATQCREL
jgi:hypothetical protein